MVVWRRMNVVLIIMIFVLAALPAQGIAADERVPKIDDGCSGLLVGRQLTTVLNSSAETQALIGQVVAMRFVRPVQGLQALEGQVVAFRSNEGVIRSMVVVSAAHATSPGHRYEFTLSELAGVTLEPPSAHLRRQELLRQIEAARAAQLRAKKEKEAAALAQRQLVVDRERERSRHERAKWLSSLGLPATAAIWAIRRETETSADADNSDFRSPPFREAGHAIVLPNCSVGDRVSIGVADNTNRISGEIVSVAPFTIRVDGLDRIGSKTSGLVVLNLSLVTGINVLTLDVGKSVVWRIHDQGSTQSSNSGRVAYVDRPNQMVLVEGVGPNGYPTRWNVRIVDIIWEG